MQFSPKF